MAFNTTNYDTMSSPDEQLAATLQRPLSADVRLDRLLGHLDSVDKILIYAFGAFDRYYICWQDKTGGYRQARRGLPCTLDEWLFPPHGSTRDLATLQVSLGHNDEFFAFDQYDRISHLNNGVRDVTSGGNMGPRKRGSLNSGDVLTSRRKSHTFTSLEVTGQDRYRPLSMEPQQGPRKRLRPQSIAISGILSLRGSHERSTSQDEVRPRAAANSLDAKYRRPLPIHRPRYSDAAVQTDLVEKQSADEVIAGLNSLATDQKPLIRGSSICPLSPTISERSSTTRDSVDSATSPHSTSSTYSRNPISMGVMGRYFREGQYRLGDSLIRLPAIGIGAH